MYTSELGYDVQQSLPCGCEVRHYVDGSNEIGYCPMHQAAPALYQTLKAVLAAFDMETGKCEYIHANKLIAAQKALASAEGKGE